MSSVLDECPHCKKRAIPVTGECLICKQSISTEQAVDLLGIPTEYQRAYHPACLNEVMRDFSCPLCKVAILPEKAGERRKCANCGHPLSVHTCHWCKAYLIFDNAERAGHYVIDYDVIPAFCHPICWPRFKENRLQKKLCLECGWPLSSWETFWKRQAHKTCS